MRRGVVALVAAATVATAPQALAKKGVAARLVNPAALRAPAEQTVSLVWTLRAGKQLFGASGIYVRLRGRAGTTTVAEAVEVARGRYRARVRILCGGVRSIVIALGGWTSDRRGTRRADLRFPIVNDPTR